MGTVNFKITDAEAHWWLTIHRRQLKEKIERLRGERKRFRGALPTRQAQWLQRAVDELEETERQLDELVTKCPEFKDIVYDFDRRDGVGTRQADVLLPASGSGRVPQA
jgi:hypothetical protein